MEFEVLTLRHPANNQDIDSSKSRTESQALHSNRYQLYLYYLSISSGSIKTCIEWHCLDVTTQPSEPDPTTEKSEIA